MKDSTFPNTLRFSKSWYEGNSFQNNLGFRCYRISQISEDHNPVHFDNEYASNLGFKRKIAHGMISSSMFSGLFGSKLPESERLFISQSFKYKKPVYIGITIKAEIVVDSVNLNRRVVGFVTTCKRNDEVVVSGDAKIFDPKT